MNKKRHLLRIVSLVILITAIMVYLFIHREHFFRGIMDAINAF